MKNDTMAKAGNQAYLILRAGFIAAPILFGIDKFFNWTTQWSDYLAPWVNNIMPGTAQQFSTMILRSETLAY